MVATTPTKSRVIRLKTVIAHIGRSRSSIYEAINPRSKYHDPRFPKPIQLGKRSVGWLSDEVDAWVDYQRELVRRNDT